MQPSSADVLYRNLDSNENGVTPFSLSVKCDLFSRNIGGGTISSSDSRLSFPNGALKASRIEHLRVFFFLPPNEGTTGKWTSLTQHAENQVESTRRECTRRLYNRCAIILELNAIILHESRTLREILRGHRARYTHTRRDAGIRVRWSFDCRWLYTCDANSEGKIDCETRASHRCV